MPPDALVAALRSAGCVFAEDEARLLRSAAADPDELAVLVARRLAGEPLEQVVGYAELRGVRIGVAPGVFVPRQRSAALVEAAGRGLCAGDVVVDLCCGSGALGMVLRAEIPGLEVYAADVDPAAVDCARRNLPPDRVFRGDLYDALPTHLRGRVEVIVANAPYVPTEEIALMPPEARDHEHRVALDGGDDGLHVQRRVIEGAPAWLRPGGRVLVESSERQAPRSADLMAVAGLVPSVAGQVVSGTRT